LGRPLSREVLLSRSRPYPPWAPGRVLLPSSRTQSPVLPFSGRGSPPQLPLSASRLSLRDRQVRVGRPLRAPLRFLAGTRRYRRRQISRLWPVRITYRPKASTEPVCTGPHRRALSKRWAELIYRIYDVDPLTCSQCGAEMKILAFIQKLSRQSAPPSPGETVVHRSPLHYTPLVCLETTKPTTGTFYSNGTPRSAIRCTHSRAFVHAHRESSARGSLRP